MIAISIGISGCKGAHEVQVGETQEELMSLLRHGYQLRYFLSNPPEEGNLTISQPKPENDNWVQAAYLLQLDLNLSSDQIPADLADYYNNMYPPDFDGPRTRADMFPLEIRDIMQNLLTTYTNLLREEELNTPETTVANMQDDVTSEMNVTITTLADFPFYLTTLKQDTTVTDTTNTTTDPNNWADGPFHFTPQIDPEYAKQMEEQFKNVKMRQSGYGRGQAFFKFIYDSDEAETPSGYELVRTETWSGPDCTDEQIADIARYIISNDFYDEQQKALMLEAVDAFLAKEEKITVADGTPNYTPAATFSQITSPDEKEATTPDTTDNTEQEVTPATPRIGVTITNAYDLDPSSPFYDHYVMLKNSGALILPMDGKVTVWPSDVIEYLNKNYPDWDTDSYTEEEIAALQDTYSHFLNGYYLMQGSDNNTFTDNTTLSTTNHLYSPDFIAWLRSYYRDEIAPKMNGIDSLTVEEAASFHEELNSFKEYLTQARIEIAYVLQDLSSYEDLAVMQDTIESYIASLNGNETDTTVTFDLPNGYIIFPEGIPVELEERLAKAMEMYFNTPKRRDPDAAPVAFISTVDAETEAVTSVQVACADTDGWRTIGTLNNPDGIDWKYKAGNLTGSGAASVVWHAQELGALGVWTDGTDNWTGIAGWFDENWTMLGCSDFNGDGKDSVLMSLNGGLFYSVDLDGTLTSLGDLNWSGWEFGAAGDFAGDGKDDIVLFHKELGCVVLLADGNADDYTSIGQLDASDWNIAGAGDLDGDGRDDLLVRQTSTGIAGAYAGGDMNRWSMIDATGEYYLA